MKMLTLFCDASLCSSTGAAGWGAWAKREELAQGLVFGGSFKRRGLNIGEAELCGLTNALTRLYNEDQLLGLTYVMFQTDNLRALQLIATFIPKIEVRDHGQGAPVKKIGSTKVSDVEKEALAAIKQILTELGLTGIVRHVRGHQAGKGRNWVNRTCDDTAKRFMRQARAERKAERNASVSV